MLYSFDRIVLSVISQHIVFLDFFVSFATVPFFGFSGDFLILHSLEFYHSFSLQAETLAFAVSVRQSTLLDSHLVFYIVFP